MGRVDCKVYKMNRPPRGKSNPDPARSFALFATVWSLRQYPTATREWSWARKFAAIRAGGFDGLMSPPRPELGDRGDLRYLAITSLVEPSAVEPTLRAAQALGAEAIGIQFGRPATTPAAALRLLRRIRAVAAELALPFAIETHRATFTERPEPFLALLRAYRRATGEALPVCLDYSHFAVVRHLTAEASWTTLLAQPAFLAQAAQLHLRPFNAHHAQLPILDARGRRTPEYREWRDRFAAPLLARLRADGGGPLRAVPELGHAAPAYGLSTHGDTWRDTLTVTRDLRALWAAAGRPA
jgi:hypothetical protein